MGPETLFRMLLATQRPGVPRLVVDVGANQGSFSLLAAQQGHRVIAFEPLPNNQNAFRRYIPPKQYPRVKLIGKGVGASAKSTVHMRGNTKGARRGVAAGTSIDVGATITPKCDASKTRCHTVQLTTLDAEVLEPVFVMKMDIQGCVMPPRLTDAWDMPCTPYAFAHPKRSVDRAARVCSFETYALRGAAKLLREHGVDAFILEFDPHLQAEQGGSAVGILRTLHAAGYVLFENCRLAFDKSFSKLSRIYTRNWGAPRGFEAFVAELQRDAAYTDLIAVHRDLVSQTSLFA